MAKFSDLDKRDEIARQSEAVARRSLNALAVTSCIVNALVQYPGPESDHAAIVASAKSMLAQADDMATRLASGLELETVPWARYRLMRMTTEAVANRWTVTSRQNDTPNADISEFFPVWREMSKFDLPTFQFEEHSDDERVMMQVSVLDAMQPVLQEIAVFDLFHNPGKAAMHAREQIVGAANQAVADLLPPNSSRRAQMQLLESLLRNAGKVYASNWRRYSERVVDRLQPMTVAQQEYEVASRPGGWPLNEIDAGFRNSFDKLADMVSFLSMPTAPSVNEDISPGVATPEKTEVSELRKESALPVAVPENTSKLLTTQNKGIFDIIDGTEEMDDVPDWEDDGPDMINDEGFASTASMVEPSPLASGDEKINDVLSC